MIPQTNDSMTTKKFSSDEKEMMVEELAEVVIDFVESHGMDSKFYLLIHRMHQNSVSFFMKMLSMVQFGL